MSASVTRALTWIAALQCPVLLALFPLLSLFAQNQSEVELSVLWWPLAMTVLGTVALCGIFFLITRRAGKAGVLASLVVLAFFYYGILFDQAGWILVVWFVVSLAALVAVLRTGRELALLTVALAVGAAVLALPQAAKIASYQLRNPSVSAADPRLWPTALQRPTVPAGTRLPDIYVIIPDDYARADVLTKYFHYDDSEFLGELRARGFAVSEQSRSPYGDSESNIAAALNMDYLTNFPRVLGKGSQDVRPVKRVMEDNRAARLLTSLGYDYVHLDTDEVTFAGGNPDISPLAAPDSFMSLWLQKSILRHAGGRLGFDDTANNDRFRTSIRSEFAELTAAPAGTRPRFVVFHTLLPHDPYIYGAQGQPVTFSGQSEEDLATRLGRAYYLRQLKYVQRLMLTSVDQILAHAKKATVVVIQADEGFQANEEPFGEAAMQDIRVKGLSAVYLPGIGQAAVPDPPNTVNTLRFVFNHYLGTDYPMLPSASYPETDLPYDFQEMQVR